VLATLLASAVVDPSGAAVRYGAKSIGALIRGSAWDAAVGDFNHDGHPDAVVVRLSSANGGIALGNGDGSFQPLAEVDPNGLWNSVAAGHLNADPHLDFVTEGVRVYLGHGDGTFDPPLIHDPSYTAYGYKRIVDIDGDTQADLISGPFIFPGNGDGTFGTPVALEAWEAADLDGDLDVDLVGVRDSSGTFKAIVYRNEGGWSFSAVDSFPLLAPDARGVQATDLDGDLIPDLLDAGRYFPGVGASVFGTPVVIDPAYTGWVRAADLDGNGTMDVIDLPLSAEPTLAELRVRRGIGGGAFAAPERWGAVRAAVGLLVDDFDADGHLDVGLPNFSGTFQVMLGNGDGTFGEACDTYPADGTPVGVAIGDAIGSDDPDVLVCSAGVSYLRILPGIGNGALGAPVDLPTAGEVRAAAVADLDADGYEDVVVACPSVVSVFRGAPGGALEPRADYAGPTSPNSVAIGHLDADARPDVAVSAGLWTYLTQPDGTLGTPTDYGGSGRSVAIAELTGDAWQDVVVETGGGGSWHVVVWPGSSTGALGVTHTTDFTSNGNLLGRIALGDVTGGSALDVVHVDDRNVKTLPGNGGGTFGTAVSSPLNLYRFATSAVVGEFTGDATADLVTANDLWTGFTVFAGIGDGTFDLETIYGTGGYPVTAVAGDLDGDGRPEVVTVNDSPTGFVTVHRPLPLDPLAVHASGFVAPGLAFTRIWPVPSRGTMHLALTLATDEPATLELLDLAGRRVHREDLDDPSPGSRTVRLAPRHTLVPGVYWARLTQGEVWTAARVLVID